jgi:hypothetical protein
MYPIKFERFKRLLNFVDTQYDIIMVLLCSIDQQGGGGCSTKVRGQPGLRLQK